MGFADERLPVATTSGPSSQIPDQDPQETAEWLESLDALIEHAGPDRARDVLRGLLRHAGSQYVDLPTNVGSDYVNTIAPWNEPDFPGDEDLERRIRAIIRWNAAIMVSRANKTTNVGGHLASYASAASLYEVGFNHFFRGPDGPDGSGDQVFFQGHASPGVYARAFLEGRLSESQLDGFRQELSRGGLPSYPHPRLLPDFWQFPTVSMGLGPLQAIYQARFNRYLQGRGIKDTTDSHVWAFLGDGEMDEPESLGALSIAAREGLDNLTFVVNCNLQRLDGPVRGNGKIVQELESVFQGAGWRVIKLVWGRPWDELFARDADGRLVAALNATPDGQMQTYSVSDGAYIRSTLFADPSLAGLVERFSDDELTTLLRARGGHDYRKVYAAFSAARARSGQPTVILAHTIKGWTLGSNFEARNATHQMKKLTGTELRGFRDTLGLPIPDSALDGLPPYFHPGQDSDEVAYLLERRRELGGFVPRRTTRAKALAVPSESRGFRDLRKGSGKQPVATTMAIVRLFKDLIKEPAYGERLVPVIPDEARTFGLDSIFPSAKIYSPHGQRYDAVDRDLLLSYREDQAGQILHEGISEAGSMASTIAAGTAYATHGEHMIPFFIFYSMFGFQRIGDQAWAMADQMGRGFMIGATAGRTTLNGEGLQHEDGHSLLLASTNPAVVAYDPAFAYEITHIVEDGLDRMFGERDEDVFYYVTVYNEPTVQPAQPDDPGVREGILAGLYRFAQAPSPSPDGSDERPRVQLIASGTAMSWALRAAELLAGEWGVAADVWSATSWNELRRDGLAADEWNLLHPGQEQRVPYVTRCLAPAQGPVVAVSDWMRAVPDQIARWVPQGLTSLGTDGFGRSDTRPVLRRHFHVDAESVVLAALTELARRGEVDPAMPAQAIERYQLLDVTAVAGAAPAGDSELS